MRRTITFPDGTSIAGGAIAGRRDAAPDFGLYAYGHPDRLTSFLGRSVNRLSRRPLHGGSWQPTWQAEWIHWPDFGVPTDAQAAARSIVAAFRRAQAGQRVEVGCYGGKGRTGTILACMAVLAGVPRLDAVRWVRAVYSERAVERERQREWVDWFASHSS
ncbi:MAG: hypothetical protein H0V12_03665 [Chloroflexi bacterium]|nr:hypothetical protein [Chloroflexota bacterium]